MYEFNFQGFRFIGSDFKPAFGCFQFLYRGYEISASNMGVDQGACPTKVAIFETTGACDHIHSADSIECAIGIIDSLNNCSVII